jgi:CBS domain-containing protein
MAIAGPAASVVVAGACLGAWGLGDRIAGWPEWATGVFLWLGFINGVLVAFNLIPGFPLDGGRVLRSILWHLEGNLRKATHTASRIGMGFGMVLIALGVVFLLFGGAIGGLWWILIGWFVRTAARRGYEQVLVRQALSGEPVRRFMTDDPVTVPPGTSLEDLVENYIYKFHFKMFPVTEDGRLAGCISTREVRDIPRDEWAARSVEDVADTCSPDTTIRPDEDAMTALARMNKADASRLLVVEDGRLIGILALKDLLKFLSLKIELEGDQPDRRDLLRAGARMADAEDADEETV